MTFIEGTTAGIGLTSELAQQTLDALRLHQLELEVQNEELRQMQRKLDAQRERYFELYDLAPVSYCTVEVGGRILEANLSAASLLGVAPGMLVQQPLSHFIHPGSQDIYYQHCQQLLANRQTQSCELQMQSKAEIPLWVNLISTLAQGAGVADLMRIVLIDISHRKEVEAALAQVHSELIQAEQVARIGTWSWDIGSGAHNWSEEVFAIYGQAPERGVVPYPEVQRFFPAESWAAVNAGVAQCLADGKPFQCDAELLRDDSTRCWINIFGTSLRDKNGVITSLHGTLQDITERKQIEQALQESERRFHDLFQKNSSVMLLVDPVSGQLVDANTTAIGYYGYPAEELIGMSVNAIHTLAPQDLVSIIEAAARGEKNTVRCAQRLASGEVREVEVQSTPLPFGGHVVLIWIVHDITAQLCLAKTLEDTLQEQSAILNSDIVGIIRLKDRKFVWVNDYFARMLGYSPKELIGQPTTIFYASEAESLALAKAAYPVIGSGQVFRCEQRFQRKDGSSIWTDISACLLKPGSTETIWSFVDIGERKRIDEQVRQFAFFDTLTALPNRRLLMDRMGQALNAVERSGCYGALIFLDLDNFKPLNDEHGHVTGDLLLIEVARRLNKCVRAVDTVARLGGDEFVVLLASLSRNEAESTAQAQSIAEEVRSSLKAPYHLSSQDKQGNSISIEHHCSASIGVVMFNHACQDPLELLKWSDAAMYQAKAAGRNRVQFYVSST